MTRRMFPAAVAALVGLLRARPALPKPPKVRSPWLPMPSPKIIADPYCPRDRIYIVGLDVWLPTGAQW